MRRIYDLDPLLSHPRVAPCSPPLLLDQIRTRFSFFLSVQVATLVGICLLTSTVSRGVLDFLILAVGVNVVAGLALTYDIREWPHRLQELPFYIVFLCESLRCFPAATQHSLRSLTSCGEMLLLCLL